VSVAGVSRHRGAALGSLVADQAVAGSGKLHRGITPLRRSLYPGVTVRTHVETVEEGLNAIVRRRWRSWDTLLINNGNI
jgi:hypothetical protein